MTESSSKKEKFQMFHANINDFENEEEFYKIVKTLSDDEQVKVMKYFRIEDRKRALLSILLQRRVIRTTFDVTDKDYAIKRTFEGKPYLVSSKRPQSWNFNVSHHGDFVCIAADPFSLVGVDIVDIQTRPKTKQSCMEYIKLFDRQLTQIEMTTIMKQPSDEMKYNMFFLIWSLKESYIKAIGLGLGFDLSLIHFDITLEKCVNGFKGYASAKIKGRDRSDWNYNFFSLDERHVMSVARGPIEDALATYATAAQLKALSNTLSNVDFDVSNCPKVLPVDLLESEVISLQSLTISE